MTLSPAGLPAQLPSLDQELRKHQMHPSSLRPLHQVQHKVSSVLMAGEQDPPHPPSLSASHG